MTLFSMVDAKKYRTVLLINHFFYDNASRPAMVKYNGVLYTYVHNLQGDIVGIVDAAGNLVVEYKYDAWGKPLSTTGTMKDTLGKLNPFRYRGYVYDMESQLYYLQRRYYDSQIGRFLSADQYIAYVTKTSADNLYGYCRNQCLNCCDTRGTITFIITNGLEDVILSRSQSANLVTIDSECSCLDDIIFGAVIPVKGGPPNGYLSGQNGNGDLYEGWYDSNGDIDWARHHSNHGNSKKHKIPHDHKGTKTEDGNPTLEKEGREPNPDYKTPKNESDSSKIIGSAIVGAYILYKGLKAAIGIFAAPVTGGASIWLSSIIP